MKNYIEFIKENRNKHEYGCAMLFFDFPELKDIEKIIDKKDLHTEGLEKEPHVTLLYGLHKDNDDNDILETIEKHKIGKLRLTNPSLFKKDEYDILKFDIKDDVLGKINKDLKKFDHTTDFPKYKPHVTIAYFNSGKGEKYVKELKGKEFTVKPNKISYGKPNKSGSSIIKKEIKI